MPNSLIRAATAAALVTAALAAAVTASGSAGAAPVSRPVRVATWNIMPPMTGPVSNVPSPAAGSIAGSKTEAPAYYTVPPAPSQCEAATGLPCYNADVLRKIYGLDGLRDEGQGTSVALILPYHNPVLRHDLDTYAHQAGLPKPNLDIITVGHPATASTGNGEQTISQMEGELDAEMIDTIAPKTRIVYVQTQQDPALTPQSFASALHVLGMLTKLTPRVDAASFSYGYYEPNYAEAAGSKAAGDAMMHQQAALINAAVRDGITVLNATGDTGSAIPNLAGTAILPDPGVTFMGDDPLVTGVSATKVTAGDNGVRTSPDTVWSNDGDNGATGGGQSALFARPPYQDPYAPITGNHRGVGDVAMDGATASPVVMYSSKYNYFNPAQLGYLEVGGTSASSPMFAGMVALAAAMAGHPLGNINPALYSMARHGSPTGIERVTSGCNGDYGVRGYCASTGPWSIPDGNGTVEDAAQFVPALAAAASRR